MLSGYQRTTLQGLGCGIDTQCGCKGMGDLLDPSTWGPADWLVAVGAAWIGWKLYTGFSPTYEHKRVLKRRLRDIE